MSTLSKACAETSVPRKGVLLVYVECHYACLMLAMRLLRHWVAFASDIA